MTSPGPQPRIEALCSQLVADPIFAMSLGSKELFHSNLLGWFLEQFPPVAEVFAAAWSGPGPVAALRVLREQRHLDLVAEVPGYQAVVVENKMFALPEEDQLDRYAAGHLSHVTASPSWCC